MALTLAIDVGGTKIAAGLVDSDGNLVQHWKQRTPGGGRPRMCGAWSTG